MKKRDIYNYLDSRGINYEITEHKAVFNMDEMAQVDLPYPEADAKNLFVRDDKRCNYYLITVKGNKRVNLKDFKKAHATRPLTFASPDELEEHLGLTPGSVTPFGLMNDEKSEVKFFIDGSFLSEPGIIGVHPNDNTATVWLKSTDLIDIIKKHGNAVEVADFES